MTQKKILIFGSGINQITLIKACNSLGYKSIAIDPNSDAPGKAIANIFEVVAPNDYKKTKEIALKYKVNGIATSQMENPLRLMANLAKELGFIFNTPESIEKGLNKFLMKQEFIKNNTPHAKGKHFIGKKDLTPELLKDFHFPLIIKPTDAHSSRGVYKVDTYKDILKYIDETISFSRSNSFLIEEFIDGPEYSIEAVTYKGVTTIVQYTEKIITPFPNVVELGHLQPALLIQEQKSAIDRVVTLAVKAIGLDNTVTHTEIKLTEKGPVVIEIGPRMAGDFISSYLVNYSCGVDLDKATILMSVGEKPDLESTVENYSFIKYLQLETGKRVQKIGNWHTILDQPGVVFANVSIKEGEIIPPITDSAKRPGFVIVKGSSRNEVNTLSSKYLNKIKETINLL